MESLQKLQAENQQSAERLAVAVQEGGKDVHVCSTLNMMFLHFSFSSVIIFVSQQHLQIGHSTTVGFDALS